MTRGKSTFGFEENRGRPSYSFRHKLCAKGLAVCCSDSGIPSKSRLGELLGVSHTTIGNWLNDGWPDEHYLKLLDVLGLSKKQGVEWLKPERIDKNGQ